MIIIFNCVYLPIGVGTFHLETAQAEFEKSITMLKSVDENIIVPAEMLLSVDKLIDFIDKTEADLAIVQNITF
ncbi:MAG: fucose isomerase, partial [Clostridia bacterium]|nr:fucose isomerase [Clostridia bacterium]